MRQASYATRRAHARRPTGWLLSLLPPVIVVAVMSWLITSGEWLRFGVAPMPLKLAGKTSFGDLIAFTSMADCVTNGTDLGTCDPYGRPYQPYIAPPARLLSLFHLGLAQTEAIGWVLLAVYALTVFIIARTTYLNWRRSTGELAALLVVFTIAAVSPPAMLVIERGQLDIIILLALLTGLLLIARNHPVLKFIGGALLVWGAYAKYFALGVFLPFLARRRFSVAGIIALVATIALMAWTWADVSLARQSSHSDLLATSRTMFGATALPVTWLAPEHWRTEMTAAELPSRTTLMAIGLGILAVFVVAWFLLARRITARHAMDAASWNLFVGGSGVLLGPFVIGLSYDYRLITVLLPIAGAMRWRATTGPASLTWALTLLAAIALVLGMWMAPTVDGWWLPMPAHLVADLALTAVLGAGAGFFLAAWLPRRRA